MTSATQIAPSRVSKIQGDDGSLNVVEGGTDDLLKRRHDTLDIAPHQAYRPRRLYGAYDDIKARLLDDVDQRRANHRECPRSQILVPRCRNPKQVPNMSIHLKQEREREY